MVINQEAKIGFAIAIFAALTILVFNYKDKAKSVEVIYFRKTGCSIVESTDKIMQEIGEKFGSELAIRTIDLDSENLTQEEIILKNKYEVIGVPQIVINGKEYSKEFTKNKIEEEICRRFLIRPEVCK